MSIEAERQTEAHSLTNPAFRWPKVLECCFVADGANSIRENHGKTSAKQCKSLSYTAKKLLLVATITAQIVSMTYASTWADPLIDEYNSEHHVGITRGGTTGELSVSIGWATIGLVAVAVFVPELLMLLLWQPEPVPVY